MWDDPAIYDILHTPGTAAEVDVLERVARTAGARTDGLWYEPACGTGRYLRVLAGRGHRVGGYDRESAMVRYARRRLGRRVRVADLTDPAVPGVRAGAVAVAIQPVSSLRLLRRDRDVLAHFAQVARLLAPGGVYLVGISLVDYAAAQPEEDVWTGARGRCRVTQVVNYLPPAPGGRTETVISHLTIARPRGVEHRDHRYALRCWDRAQWRRLLGRSALGRAGSFAADGRPLPEGAAAAYQLEVLERRPRRA